VKISLVPFARSKAWVIEDELWELIVPLLPPWPARAPGPRPVPDRRTAASLAWDALLTGSRSTSTTSTDPAGYSEHLQ
jgi:hypothetical protein